MAKNYYRIFLKEDMNNYLTFRLIQQGSDESLMLKIESSKSSEACKIGKIEIIGNTFEILYSKINEPAEVDHTSIHATGQSHTKLTNGELIINYGKNDFGIPLAKLKTVKHLGTLIIRKMTDGDKITPVEKTEGINVIIERGIGQKCSIIDILAIPKESNVNFNCDWEMHNEREVKMTISLSKLPFNGFDTILFVRSSDQFDKLPDRTLHLSDMNNIVPFILELDDEKALIKLSALKFEEVIKLENGENVNQKMSTLRAVSKYL